MSARTRAMKRRPGSQYRSRTASSAAPIVTARVWSLRRFTGTRSFRRAVFSWASSARAQDESTARRSDWDGCARSISSRNSVTTRRMLSHGMRILVAAVAVFSVAPAFAQAPSTLIQSALVLDGTGSPARELDVRIANGRIAAVGALAPQPNDRAVDGRGLVLAPGFIDTHSHHDRGLFTQREALAAVSQGITTIVAGQDGGSQFPLRQFFARLDSQPVAVNVG